MRKDLPYMYVIIIGFSYTHNGVIITAVLLGFLFLMLIMFASFACELKGKWFLLHYIPLKVWVIPFRLE